MAIENHNSIHNKNNLNQERSLAATIMFNNNFYSTQGFAPYLYQQAPQSVQGLDQVFHYAPQQSYPQPFQPLAVNRGPLPFATVHRLQQEKVNGISLVQSSPEVIRSASKKRSLDEVASSLPVVALSSSATTTPRSTAASQIDYVDITLTNTITNRVPKDVKKNILAPYLRDVMPTLSDIELLTKNYHLAIIRSLSGLEEVIDGKRHIHKEIEGIVFMAMIAEYLNRHSPLSDGVEFSVSTFQQAHSEIYTDSVPHLTKKFKLETLVTVWQTFHTAIKVMGVNPSGKKSGLIVAANLLADPTSAMTTGSRQVIRTTMVERLYHSVTGIAMSSRPSRSKKTDVSVSTTNKHKRARAASVASYDSESVSDSITSGFGGSSSSFSDEDIQEALLTFDDDSDDSLYIFFEEL